MVDEHGESVDNGQHGGYLVIKKPWPSHAAHHLGRPGALQPDLLSRRTRRQVLPGRRLAPAATTDGYFWIMGRIDDVLNVSGHRLGTMEIESALVAHADWLPKRRWSAGRTMSRAKRSSPSWCCKGDRPDGRSGRSHGQGIARLGGQADRPDRQARRDPFRRQPAQDPLGQDHAAAAACASPRARKSPRTSPPWRIRRSWTS